MDLLIILTYVAIAARSIFKIFKIPVNKWTVPTAALGAYLLLARLFY